MPMGPGAKTVLVGGWVGGWAGSPTGRYQDLETGTEWFTAEKGFVYQPKIIPQRDTVPRCAPIAPGPKFGPPVCPETRDTLRACLVRIGRPHTRYARVRYARVRYAQRRNLFSYTTQTLTRHTLRER